MKILIFYQYFGTPKGGWSTRFYEFTRRWVAEGHQVTVITSPYYKSDIKAKGFISKQQIEGVDLIVINTPDSNKEGVLKRALKAITFAFTSVFYSLTLSYDLVLASSGPITIGIPALASKILRGKKMVFEVRDLWPRGGIELGKIKKPLLVKTSLWFERFCYKKADLVVACSQGMRDGVVRVSPQTKTLVIPNSSDTALFGQINGTPQYLKTFNSSAPILIYIGSLGFMDDCSQILRGLNAANHLDFQMFFLGDGEEKEELQKLSENFGLNQKVKFLGLLPKLEVVEWMVHARASFVTFRDFPVLHTNSPNKMFDSFAAGVPIIQSTKGWIKNLVQSENVGWNVDPADPETFAKAIEEAITAPQLAKLKGENAKRLAETLFNRDKLAETYLDHLIQIVE